MGTLILRMRIVIPSRRTANSRIPFLIVARFIDIFVGRECARLTRQIRRPWLVIGGYARTQRPSLPPERLPITITRRARECLSATKVADTFDSTTRSPQLGIGLSVVYIQKVQPVNPSIRDLGYNHHLSQPGSRPNVETWQTSSLRF